MVERTQPQKISALTAVPVQEFGTVKGPFLGRPATDANPLYIVREGSDKATITVGTTQKSDSGIVHGASGYYLKLLPDSQTPSPIIMIPPIQEAADLVSLDAASLLADMKVRTLFFSGGDDLGELYTGKTPEGSLATYYGVNSHRDEIESRLLQESITGPRSDEIFFMGICRGFQLLTAELTNKKVLPQEVIGHRPNPDPLTGETSTIPDHHQVENVLPTEIREGIEFPDVQRMTSHHHQGVLYEELEPYLPDLAKMGWYVALIANEQDVKTVEAMVKAKKDEHGNWVVLGAAVQGHPERHSGQHDKSEEEWKQAEADNETLAAWLREKQSKFLSSTAS